MRVIRKYAPLPLLRLAAWLLPLPSRLSSPNVSEVHSHMIREGIRLNVYRLGGAVGPGIGASFVAFGDEVMRFDCFGKLRGHMHINMKQTRIYPGGVARLYYYEQTVEEQVERSCFEFEHNLTYALQTNNAARIRRLRLESEEIREAAAFLHQNLIALLVRHRPNLPYESAVAPPID